MKIVTAEQMRWLDRFSIDSLHIPSLELMENAGRASAETILSLYSISKRAVLLVGRGNNGGDGLVVARHLSQVGWDVTPVLTCDIDELSPDARHQWEKMPVHLPTLDGRVAGPSIEKVLANTDLIIDALFGTGLARPIDGPVAKLIEQANQSERPIVSLDLPSGLSANTGDVLGVAIAAAHTISFALPKRGFFFGEGIERTGRLHVVDIGIPEAATHRLVSSMEMITPASFSHLLTPRHANDYKGTHGHVAVLAGSTGKLGAGWLAARAALRVGAGLVTYAMPKTAYDKFDHAAAEVMVMPIDDENRGSFAPSSLVATTKLIADKGSIAIGPGIGQESGTREWLGALLSQLKQPTVIDADGLNILATLNETMRKAPPLILTPHAGEMGRLLGLTTDEILQRPVESVIETARRYRAITLLKGARTLVATPDGHLSINPTGDPAMGTAGMGDALTGVIAGIVAQKIDPLEATLAGVYLHGLAGSMAAHDVGPKGVITTDVIERLPQAIMASMPLAQTTREYRQP